MEESKIYTHKTCRWYQVGARLWLCFLQVCRCNFFQKYCNSGLVRSNFDRFLFFHKTKQNKEQNNQTKQRFTQHKRRRQQKRPDTLIRNYIPDPTCRFLRLSLLKLISKRVKQSPHNHKHPTPSPLPHLSHHFTSVLVALRSLFCCGLFLHDTSR